MQLALFLPAASNFVNTVVRQRQRVFFDLLLRFLCSSWFRDDTFPDANWKHSRYIEIDFSYLVTWLRRLILLQKRPARTMSPVSSPVLLCLSDFRIAADSAMGECVADNFFSFHSWRSFIFAANLSPGYYTSCTRKTSLSFLRDRIFARVEL